MIVTHLCRVGPAFLAVAAVSVLVDRSGDGPLYVPKPAYANMARVRTSDQVPASGSPGSVMRFSRARDGLFYVRARVNGVPVRFVLDTGATLVVLTPQDARRVGLPNGRVGAGDRMETAGGVSNISRVTIDRVTVAGHVISDVDAAIVDNGMKTSLLGQSLLSQLGSITLSADEAELR